MTDTNTADSDTRMNGIWNSPNNQSTENYAGANLKTRRDKDPKIEDSISRSVDQTQTLLHYTVYALSNTRTYILKLFGNQIITFTIDYFMELSLF